MEEKNKQITLWNERESIIEIKKHSSIIQMKNASTLQQRKCMNTFIWIAKKVLDDNPNERRFRMDFTILKRLSGIKALNNEQLKDSLRSLVNMKLEYNILGKDKEQWGFFSFLSEAKITSNGKGKEGFIEFEFPGTIIEAIKKPSLYTKLDLCLIRGLNSKYSMGLYELLKDYQKLGTFKLSIKDFRDVMGVEVGQYTIFTMLKKRIIDSSVNEINEKTDLIINYELLKNGNKINYIIFQIKQKQDENVINNNKIDIGLDIEKNLKKLGFLENQIKDILYKYDIEYIKGNLESILDDYKSGKIKKVIPYFLKALEKDFRPQKNEFTKIKEKQKLDRKKVLEQKEIEEQKALERKEEQKAIIRDKVNNFLKIPHNKEKAILEFGTFLEEKQSFLYKYWDNNPDNIRFKALFYNFINENYKI